MSGREQMLSHMFQQHSFIMYSSHITLLLYSLCSPHVQLRCLHIMHVWPGFDLKVKFLSFSCGTFVFTLLYVHYSRQLCRWVSKPGWFLSLQTIIWVLTAINHNVGCYFTPVFCRIMSLTLLIPLWVNPLLVQSSQTTWYRSFSVKGLILAAWLTLNHATVYIKVG